jgi:hypothetical protein
LVGFLSGFGIHKKIENETSSRGLVLVFPLEIASHVYVFQYHAMAKTLNGQFESQHLDCRLEQKCSESHAGGADQ